MTIRTNHEKRATGPVPIGLPLRGLLVAPIRGRRRRLALAAALCVTASSGSVASASGQNNPCGSTVTSSVKLERDLRCSGDGLHVAGRAPVLIDLNGHTIRGTGGGRGITVDNNAAVTIVNGSVRGFASGVSGSNGEIHIDKVTVRDTPRPVFMGAAGKMRIVRSALNGPAQVGSPGFQLGEMEVRDSRIHNVTFQFWSGGGGHRFENNTFSGGGNIFASQVNTFTISGNRFTGARTAVELRIGNGHVLTNNRFTDNEVGLLLSESWGTDVTDNFFADNHGVGAFVTHPVPFPGTIARNHFRGNGASGLYMTSLASQPVSFGAVVSDNRFTRNGFHPGDWVDGAGKAMTAGAAIVPRGASGVAVTGNIATFNAGLGISADNVVDGGGNRARRNGDPQQCAGVSC